MRGQFPNSTQTQIPNSMQAQFPNSMQGQFPNSMQAQFPNSMQGQFPNSMQAQFPNSMQAQFPNPMQAQIQNSMQPQIPNSMQLISAQMAFAQQRYRTITQESQNVYSIVFPEDPKHSTFKITIPSNYPECPPSISRNGEELNLPMTKNWVPSIQLLYLFDHLHLLSSVPEPLNFNFIESEVESTIRRANISQLSTNEGRLAVILQSPCMEKAQKYSQKADASLSSVEPQLNDLKPQLEAAVNELNSLLIEKSQYQSKAQQQQIAEPPTISQEQMEQLNAEILKSQQNSQAIIQQFHSKQITIDQFIELLYNEKKNENYYKCVIQNLNLGF